MPPPPRVAAEDESLEFERIGHLVEIASGADGEVTDRGEDRFATLCLWCETDYDIADLPCQVWREPTAGILTGIFRWR